MDARRDDNQAVSLVGWLKFPGRAGGGGAFKLTNDKWMYRQPASSADRLPLTFCMQEVRGLTWRRRFTCL